MVLANTGEEALAMARRIHKGQDHFDIGFSHRLTQIPMHEEMTESIQNAAQVIEGAAQVDVGNVDMPVLMGLQRLLETGSLARWLARSDRD